MKEQTWQRHSNPWSGWSRMLGYWGLLFAVYQHSWLGLAAVILFLIFNPKLFPAPKTQNAWMSKAVLGERLYTKSGILKKDLPTLLNFLNLPFFIASIYFAYTQDIGGTVASGLLSTTYKLWFLDRMVTLYDHRPKDTSR